MSARQPWLFCLSTMFGTALTLSACSSDDEPPVGGVGSGSMSGGVTSSNNSSSSSGTDDDTGSLTAGDGDSAGDGDGETGNITAGDGDAGTGNLTAGDGDGDGTGGSSFQQCNEFVSAGDDCGLLEADLAPLLGSCEASFEIGLVEQGD